MSGTNGFFGMIQGPFSAEEEIVDLIQKDCAYPINYISKIGIHYTGEFCMDIGENGEPINPFFIILNNNDFMIGRSGHLQFEDVEITSIKVREDIGDSLSIDYQYQ